MGKIKDISGQRFGNLTALEPTNERRNRQVVWKCQCDCGNITYVVGEALRNLTITSCGCSRHKPKAKDLTGQKFGKLTVIERDFSINSSDRKAFWKCRCDCGNVHVARGTDLRNGQATQCFNCAKIYKQNPLGINNKGIIKDLRGKRFGKLLAIEPLEKRSSAGRVIWKCRCDCGNFCEVESLRLTSLNTISCGCLTISAGEQIIQNILKENGVVFKQQFSFPDCTSSKGAALLFDFAIFDRNEHLAYLIEFDGKQHFQPIEYFGGQESFNYQKECDKIKDNYCQKNKIPLIRIPYTQKKYLQVEDVIKSDLL